MDRVLVEEDRIASLIQQLGEVGRLEDGGITRPVYSEEWSQAQELVASFCEDAGLEVRVDAVGNVFGRLEGEKPDEVILTGSHVDTVASGGAYDGAYGVLAAISALEAAQQLGGTPHRTVEVVSLCEEEGSRFPANYLGTRAIHGLISPEEFTAMTDADGVSLADAARERGFDPQSVRSAKRDDIRAFLEVHIEQSRNLYDSGVEIGIVPAICGVSWLKVVVTGRTDHAGATPMTYRADAMQAATRMITRTDELVRGSGPPLVGTVGRMHVEPGGVNVIPGRVEFYIDLRHPDDAMIQKTTTQLLSAFADIAADQGVDVKAEPVKYTPATTLDPDLQQTLITATEQCGYTWAEVASGAGHDSQTMAKYVPTAMAFIPSVDGRSHSPAEYSTPADCAHGASVLATALRNLAWDQP